MDKLKEIFQSIWLKIEGLCKNFEDSPLFERIMRRYESLSPNGQGIFKGLVKVSALLVVAFMILGGPFLLLSKLSDIQNLEELESEAATFQSEFEAQTRGFTPPSGWRPLAADSATSLATAFNEYLPSIGVPEEFGTLLANGDTLKLVLKEISIRQATNILFQLEGLYPKVQAQVISVRPNLGQRDILDLDATFKFNAAFANQISAVAPDTQGTMNEENLGPPPTSIPAPPRNTPNLPNGNADNPDFQNEYIPPPPPPPGGDYDEFAPPDLPDDLPPPPPPPGFEEEP
jgi:hypothetical protein